MSVKYVLCRYFRNRSFKDYTVPLTFQRYSCPLFIFFSFCCCIEWKIYRKTPLHLKSMNFSPVQVRVECNVLCPRPYHSPLFFMIYGLTPLRESTQSKSSTNLAENREDGIFRRVSIIGWED